MISYNNSEHFKKKSVEDAVRHAELDQLVSGHYGKMNGQFIGCSVGCDAFDIKQEVVEDGVIHSVTSEHFGWPEWVEHLRDGIFEGLAKDDATQWHLEFKEAMPIGLSEPDFNKIKAKFLIFILKQNSKRVSSLQIGENLRKQVLDAIDQCLSAQEQAVISGRIAAPAAPARSAAESAAWSAAWSAESAADSAAESAAESAAWSAAGSARSAARSADSAAWSAESAAWSAAWSAESAADSAAESADSAARSAEYKLMADNFLVILKEHKND